MKKGRLIVSLVIPQLAGILGSLVTFPAISSWYKGLIKPSFSPPNWLFGPAWTFLYLLMGISLYLVWQKGTKKKEVKVALLIFSIQLFLNIVWSFLFFGLHQPLYAFIEIMIMWLTILATIISSYQVSKPAGLILIPYLLWVSFASVLNFFVFRLNF